MRQVILKRVFQWVTWTLLALALQGGLTSCGAKKEIAPQANASKAILERLNAIPGVTNVRQTIRVSHFDQNFELWFEQPIDHKDPNSATFYQRVLIGHVNQPAPVVTVLEGYRIYSGRASEPAALLRSNQITIEHRFFGRSKPQKIPWDNLTIWQAASDHHHIIEEIKMALYPEASFLSTGISKGGQCTMIHRSLYPDDVDASICYVAPLNFKREDERIYTFLNTVGSQEDRDRILAFQQLCFERKAELVDLLEALAKEKKYSWSIGYEKAIEYYILEYSFAFWQWGNFPISAIPNQEASTKKVFDHLLNVSGIDFFEDKGVEELRPFFWAALTEIGMYGYETDAFAQYLGTNEPYLFDFTAPEGTAPTYDPAPMQQVHRFLQNKAQRMLFVYGGLDTWGATKVELEPQATARDNHVIVDPKGHHGTRINSLPVDTRKRVLAIITRWMQPGS